MRNPIPRLALAGLSLVASLLLTLLAQAAHAQTSARPDSGMWVIFEASVPMARENYAYQFMGDSMVVTATTQRQFQDEQGGRHLFSKTMALVVDAHDLGLMRYVSNQDFNGHKSVRGLLPGDTVMTYYDEFDGAGNAERLVQPPGRLFVLDPQMFTLFDVLCRSLANKQFESRRVQLLALAPDSLTMPLATITRGKPDTLTWGGSRVPTRHYTLVDQGTRFELWADARGRMLRMANEPSGLRVELADPVPAARRAKTPPPKKH